MASLARTSRRRFCAGNRRARGWLLLLGACAPLCVSGCGVGGLIAGGIAGAVLGSGDGGSSGSSRVLGSPFLSPPPTRQAVRGLRRADVVQICYQLGGTNPEHVLVEFARESDAFAAWQPASRHQGESPGPPCDGTETFWWDAATDLGLGAGSERVRVRVRSTRNTESGSASEPFLVGNTAPEIELLPLEDEDGDGAIDGDVSIRFGALDAEGDYLEDVRLYYQVPPLAAAAPCGAAAPRVASSSPLPQEVEDPGEVEMRLDPPLRTPLELSASAATFFAGKWDSTVAKGGGRHNVAGITVRVRARDPFGRVVEAVSSIDVRNNGPPEVGFPEATLDTSHEIPVPFVLRDDDGDPVDVLIQYALVAGAAPQDDEFPPLLPQFEGEPEFRRWVLEDPEAAFFRSSLRLATPSARDPRPAPACGLPSSPAGTEHTFLWDASRDLGPLAVAPARLRITPYDEELGTEARLTGLRVDNDLYPTATERASGIVVSGTALGDLDGDARADVAISLPEAPAFPGDEARSADLGRVEVYFRGADGGLAGEPLRLVPGPREEAVGARGPRDLAIADVDGDGANDLVVLGTRCAGGACLARGEVSLFLGGRLKEAPLVLRAGKDLRSLCVGDFDGRDGLDIAVSVHDDLEIGVFFQGTRAPPPAAGPPSFSAMRTYCDIVEGTCAEPGIIVAADFDGDKRDDVVARERVAQKVWRLSWSEADLDLVGRTAVVRDFLDLDDRASFAPVSLAAPDLDADGRPDLLVGSRDPDAPAAYLFSSQIHAGGGFQLLGKACLAGSPEELAAADLTQDGRIDLLAVEPDLQGGSLELVSLDGAGGCCAPSA
ncbi:MAG: hypothetical protein HY721_02425, partial [Planctomycetes bacterium]|nr:hypothetical protein [Planctomycetota bacterium]